MTIVVGYVPGDLGAAVIEVAAQEAQWRSCELIVVNVARGEALVDETFASQPEIRDLKSRLDVELSRPVDVRQVDGSDVASTLLEVASDVGATLLVVGVRHRRPTGKLIFGSTSQHIVLEADCPVLTVKAPHVR